MLLNKAFNQGDVVTFKMVSGEEVLARYQSETPLEYTITKPISLTPTPNGNIGMVPTVFSADLNTNVNLQKSAVAATATPRKEFADEYIQATTKIKPASSLEGLINAKSSSTG